MQLEAIPAATRRDFLEVSQHPVPDANVAELSADARRPAQDDAGAGVDVHVFDVPPAAHRHAPRERVGPVDGQDAELRGLEGRGPIARDPGREAQRLRCGHGRRGLDRDSLENPPGDRPHRPAVDLADELGAEHRHARVVLREPLVHAPRRHRVVLQPRGPELPFGDHRLHVLVGGAGRGPRGGQGSGLKLGGLARRRRGRRRAPAPSPAAVDVRCASGSPGMPKSIPERTARRPRSSPAFRASREVRTPRRPDRRARPPSSASRCRARCPTG